MIYFLHIFPFRTCELTGHGIRHRANLNSILSSISYQLLQISQILFHFFQFCKGGEHFLSSRLVKIHRDLIVTAAFYNTFHNTHTKFDMLHRIAHIIGQPRRLLHLKLFWYECRLLKCLLHLLHSIRKWNLFDLLLLKVPSQVY